MDLGQMPMRPGFENLPCTRVAERTGLPKRGSTVA
jgi:hypothetical protein